MSSYSWCGTLPLIAEAVNDKKVERAIGRDLTDDERLRFGVPDWVRGKN